MRGGPHSRAATTRRLTLEREERIRKLRASRERAMKTLTVRADDRHTITGPRFRALAHFQENGIALWWRADGRATLFFRDPKTGKRRQKTWARTIRA